MLTLYDLVMFNGGNTMTTFTPCRVNLDGTESDELAPVCNMTREDAIQWARAAYGDDAGIQDDTTRDVEWVSA